MKVSVTSVLAHMYCSSFFQTCEYETFLQPNTIEAALIEQSNYNCLLCLKGE